MPPLAPLCRSAVSGSTTSRLLTALTCQTGPVWASQASGLLRGPAAQIPSLSPIALIAYASPCWASARLLSPAWRTPASFLRQGVPHHFPVTSSFTPKKPLCGHCSIFFFLSLDCFRLWAENRFQGAPTSHVARCQYYVQLLNTDWA